MEISDFFDAFFKELSYGKLYVISTLHFAFLYFGLGWLFWKMCTLFFKIGWAERINQRPFSPTQLRFEIRQSIYSILIFGFSVWPLAYGIRVGIIDLSPNTFSNIALDLILLTVWNEVHFYLIHRLLHIPILMKYVHHIHHRSLVPSVFSVYSFHPIEAALLSSVLMTIAPFWDFCPLALMLFPTVSILINFRKS